MSTPTSQAPSRNPGATLEEVLVRLGAGSPSTGEILALSDLDRAAAEAFRNAWLWFPLDRRVTLVRRMDELLEDRIDLNFGHVLRVALDDSSAVVRQLAVTALWEDDSNDLLDRLLNLLRNDPSPDVRAAAAEQLGRFAERAEADDLDADLGARVRTALHAVLAVGASPLIVRRRALEAVASFASDPAVGGLIEEAFDSDEPGLRASALYAMGRSLNGRWLDLLIDELESDDGELRYEAARACGAIGDDRVLPALAPLTDDPDAEVRHAAIAALGRIGGRAASHVLERLLAEASDVDTELIEAAIDEAAEGMAFGRNLG